MSKLQYLRELTERLIKCQDSPKPCLDKLNLKSLRLFCNKSKLDGEKETKCPIDEDLKHKVDIVASENDDA